jgi:hypothetical protein
MRARQRFRRRPPLVNKRSGYRGGLGILVFLLTMSCTQQSEQQAGIRSSDPTPTSGTRPADCPVARVGAAYVYYSDLVRASRGDEERAVPVPGWSREELIFNIRYKLLDKLIVRETLRQEAEEMGIHVTDEEVDQWIEGGGPWTSPETLGGFYPWLRDLSPEDFRRELKVDMMVFRAARQRIGELAPITERDVRNFYEEHRDSLHTPPEVKAFVLLIRKEGRTREEALRRINGIRTSLEIDLNAADSWEARSRIFADYARLYSEHHASDMGGYWVVRPSDKEDEDYRQFERIAYEVPLQTLSGVHEMKSGFFVTMVESRKEGVLPPYDIAQEKIRGLLLFERNKNSQQELFQLLKEKYRPSAIRENILGCGAGVP